MMKAFQHFSITVIARILQVVTSSIPCVPINTRKTVSFNLLYIIFTPETVRHVCNYKTQAHLVQYCGHGINDLSTEDAMALLRMCHICYIGRIPEDVSPDF